MKPREFLIEKRSIEEQIVQLECQLDALPGKVEFPKDEELRPAKASDIRVGEMIFYPENPRRNSWIAFVQDVMWPDDDFKAYMSEDGCRYGLRGAFVLKRTSSPQ